jgi:CheY-like chemotaxis protein
MDALLQEQIFEPFFTTKEAGKGTGLGLANVLGIVEQYGGVIRCKSGVGEGTSFRLLLPAVEETVGQPVQTPAGLVAAPTGTESILLVEDEDTVRSLMRRILEASGYSVVEARNGLEGLNLFEIDPHTIDLLVIDLVMPLMGGREMADAVRKLCPGLRVLFVTGHMQEVVLKEGIQQGEAFLHKPFTPLQLAQKVRETLDGG